MNSNPHVICIIVNWNGWQDTVECLHALNECDYPRLSTIVVDNGSTNDSIDRIRTAHPDILLIESKKNLGFAGGNNVGIRYALDHRADYVWLLNNDTKPSPDALSELVAKALTDDKIGAVASVTYFSDSPANVEAWAGARVNLAIGYSKNSRMPRDDSWFHSLNGTSMLVSCRTIREAGLLDEGFFLYWEDTEFCLRLRKLGWRIAAAPESRVLHKVHASTNGNQLVLDRYQTTSGLRLLRLHSPAPYPASLAFLVIRFARRLARLQFDRCRSIWAGIQDYRRMRPISPKIR